LSFLYVELTKPSVGIPRLQLRGTDRFVVFLFIGDLIRFKLFWTPRSDGLAVLNEGLSIGNISEIVWTSIAALYLAYILLSGRFRISWLSRTPYFSIFFLIAVYLLTILWSVTKIYTLYRGCELVVWASLSVYFFTRLESYIHKVMFLALYSITWCLLNVPVFLESLSSGIIFSSIKENIIPVVGFSIVLFGWATRLRLMFFLIGMSTFVFAGSATSVACAITVCFIGLAFHRNVGLKLVGYFGAFLTLTFIVVYLLVPDQFPDVIEFLSYVLQKPSSELLAATGRYAIWQILWEVSQNQYFGTGFGTDRFVQLLAGLGQVSERFGSDINLNSAHDAVLSAWIGAGWLGVTALLFVYATGIRYCAKYGGRYRTSTTMILVFIVINSLTVPGLGTYYSPYWLIWIAALSIAAAEQRARVKAQPGALSRTSPRIRFVPTSRSSARATNLG